jgi:hypothetical protein
MSSQTCTKQGVHYYIRMQANSSGDMDHVLSLQLYLVTLKLYLDILGWIRSMHPLEERWFRCFD